MLNRTIHVFVFALCAALAGCGWNPLAPAPKEFAPPPPSPSEIARRDLLKIAKRIEDPANFDAIEQYVANFEDPAKGWTWADLNEYISNGSYSIQTKVAYENWRRLKILESKK